jgi:hypothetical protein
MTFKKRLRSWLGDHRFFVSIFFAVFFLIGLFIYRDYGFTGDTSHQKLIGETSFNYIFHNDKTLFSSVDKEYGAAFELLITFLYTLFNLTTDYQIYYFRHLIIFCSFFIGVIFFYRIVQLRFNSWRIGLFGSLLLILSPRIFDSAFVNSKDIPFMVLFIISAYTLFKLDEKMRVQEAVIHGLVTGFMIAIRPLGILMVGFTGLLWLIKLIASRKQKRGHIGHLIGILGAFLISTIGFMILWWPWLWPDPINNFLYSLKSFSQYTTWRGEIVYIGKIYGPTELPWHYTPVWILVTTPLIYSFFALIGLFSWVGRIIRRQIDLRLMLDRIDLIIAGWFVLPLLVVAVLHSVLYSGWRHLFFIYPAMLILTISGMTAAFGWLDSSFKSKQAHKVLRAAILMSLVGTFVSMILNHPYESMYFTILAGKNTKSAKFRYGLDFYGLCAKEAVDFVLADSDRDQINIFPSISVVQRSAFLLPLSERERIRWTPDYNLADYFIGAYTNQREEFVPPDNYRLIYAVERGGADMCVVYQNRDDH